MEETIKWVKGDRPRVGGGHLVIYTTIVNGKLTKKVDFLNTRCVNSGLKLTEKGLESVPESERIYEFIDYPNMVIEYHAEINIPKICQ